ncbi:MAG: hypothetical protein LQ351_001721 [Letrouitia transgressa]|nr:MAG: hypothetical protein LQ351_001721 [Letrouitia transgressa]
MDSDATISDSQEPDEAREEVSGYAEKAREELSKRRKTASGFEPLPGSFPSAQDLLRPRFVIRNELDGMRQSALLQSPTMSRDPGLNRDTPIRNHEQHQNAADVVNQILPQASSAIAAFFNDPTSPSYNPDQPAQVTIPYQGEISTLTLERLEDPRFVHAMISRYEIRPTPQAIKHFGSVEQYDEWQKDKCPVLLTPLEIGNRPVPILRKVDGRWKCPFCRYRDYEVWFSKEMRVCAQCSKDH